MQKELIKNNHQLLEEGNRKNKFTNTDKSYIYTTKCLCSRALDFDSPSDFCHNNNDLFIAQDGTIQLCRLKSDEVTIIDETKNRQKTELIKKLKLSFDKLGKGCPYEK